MVSLPVLRQQQPCSLCERVDLSQSIRPVASAASNSSVRDSTGNSQEKLRGCCEVTEYFD
jgi:hypothetical protein